jgi:hypothetical protein
MHLASYIKNENASSKHTPNTQHSYKPFAQRNKHNNVTKNLSINNQPIGCVRRMNLPTIGVVVRFLSIVGHPRVEAMIPQGDLTLLVVHSPHTSTPKPGFYSQSSSNPPTLFPHILHNPRNVPPSLLTIPQDVPFVYHGFHCTQLVGNLSVGDSRNSQLL